ncbi:MAG: cation:proton antiporter [Candidatus Omnitrophica bacterium]|nr:cation:proton antiporter [Candidatus Omnitrophota bacterium]
MHYLSEQNLLIFLLQVFLLLGLARGLGEIFRRFKQPALTAEILVGVFLGPTILGRFMPGVYGYIFPHDLIQQNMLETTAWIGVLFFLLKTGLEIDFSSAWRQRGEALTISLSDVVIPMVIAFIPCYFLADKYAVSPDTKIAFSFFVATIMTISALPVTARVLSDLNLYKTDMGFLIMCALSVNDLLGWVVFTLILGFFTQTNIDLLKIVIVIGSTIGFSVFCLTYGRKLSNLIIGKIKEKNMPEPGTAITFICLLGIICGAATLKIGIHALFGFFIAGIMAGEAKALSEKTRQVISQMVHSLFIPLFFASVGLKIDFLNNFDLWLVIFIFVIGFLGRFLGAWIGVTMAKSSRADRLLISLAHTPGGEMQIVIGILALEYKLITEPVFVAIVFGAVLSTVILGPLMSLALRLRKHVDIRDYFIKRAVINDLEANDKEGAIKELSETISSQENMPDTETIYSTVIERENQMGTGIEKGISVPHGRISSLIGPVIAFGRSRKGIEWDSPDGNPAKYIFMILSPKENTGVQLQILRLIAMVMSDDSAINKFNSAKGQDELWEVLRESFSEKSIIKN